MPRAPRPVVLLIVFGLFLVVVGVTTTAQTILLSSHFSNAALNEIVGGDAGTVRSFVNLNLSAADLTEQARSDRRQALVVALASLVRNGNLSHIEVRLPDGRVVASDDGSLVGTQAPITADFSTALTGTIAPRILDAGMVSETATILPNASVLREYLPVTTDGTVRAIVGVWRDAEPVLRAMDDLRRQVIIVTLSGALVAGIFLFLVFRAAQARISRQTLELVESTRRDPLTSLLNHGALLTTVADRIEAVRTDPSPIGIALVDIDGFRLLNDAYGHEAGDIALAEVASRLVERFDESAVVGRYGPDEFLVVVDAAGVSSLEPAMEALQHALAQGALEVDSAERLPI